MLIATLISGISFSQSKAEKLFKKENYFETISVLKSKESTEKLSILEKELLALSYYYNNDYTSAYKYFSDIIDSNSNNDNILFYYSHCAKSIDNIEQSNKYLKKYFESKKVDMSLYFDDIETVKRIGNRFQIDNLKQVNTEYSDVLSFDNDGHLYFSSTKPTKLEAQKYKWNNQPYLDIYHLKKDSIVKNMTSINTEFHDSDLVINKSNGHYFLTSSKPDPNLFLKKDQVLTTKIYQIIVEDNKVKKSILLPFNSNEYSCKSPFVDYKNNRLYFSSNCPGGKGGFDIYYTELNNPIHIYKIDMDDINTINDEDNFFIDYSNNNIYFTSNGFVGFGGKDIYTKVFDDQTKKHKRIMNIGFPINSKYDDFNFISNGINGYFSSNRKSGKGDDDVYSFVELFPLDLDKIIQSVSGRVTNKQTGNAIVNAKIKLINSKGNILEVKSDNDGNYKINDIPGNSDYKIIANADRYLDDESKITLGNEKYANVLNNISLQQAEGFQTYKGIITDNITGKPLKNALISIYDTSGKIIGSTKTDENGNYEITAPLNKRIQIRVSLNESEDPYYAEYQEYLETTDEWGKIYDKNIKLVQTDSRGLISDKDGNILIPTKPIYFAYNSSKIENISFEELDKVSILLNEHPTWKLIIESHSDDRGSDNYNLKLSEKRAVATKDYLVKIKNIDPSRISCKGYGEIKPLIDCLTKECSEEEYFINRRSEFKIK